MYNKTPNSHGIGREKRDRGKSIKIQSRLNLLGKVRENKTKRQINKETEYMKPDSIERQ
jgi:hypothetical protein